MKNVFKYGFLAIAVSLSVAACGSNQTDGDTTNDTMMSDTTMMDTMMTDTAMTDTSTM